MDNNGIAKSNRMISTWIKTNTTNEVHYTCVYDWGCYEYEVSPGQKVIIKLQASEQFQTLTIDGEDVLGRSDGHNGKFNATIYAGRASQTEYDWFGKVVLENLHVKADPKCITSGRTKFEITSKAQCMYKHLERMI